MLPKLCRTIYFTFFSSLALGVLIYLIFRDIPFLNVSKIFSIKGNNNPVLKLIFYSLPDAIWLYAFLTALKIIWKDRLFIEGKYWLFLAAIGACASEFAQKLQIIPGTFDWFDIVAYFLAISLFISFNKTIFITQNKPTV